MIELNQDMIWKLTAAQADKMIGKRFMIEFNVRNNGGITPSLDEVVFVKYTGIYQKVNYFYFMDASGNKFDVVYIDLLSMFEI